ncbi:MAG: sensor histidine kinase [Bdellovibrionota bacterium]
MTRLYSSPYRKAVLVFVAYVAISLASLRIQLVTGMETQVWPAAGIAFAAVLFWGYAVCPSIFLGTLVVHLIHGDPLLPFLGPALGNTIEPIVGVKLCVPKFGFHASLQRPQSVVCFLVGAGLISTFVGTVIGVPWLALWNYHHVDYFYFTQYWVGDSLGVMIGATPILVFATPNKIARFTWKSASLAERYAFLVVTAAVITIFSVIHGPIRLYFFFPVMLWAAIRVGQRGVSILSLGIAAVAIWQTAIGRGPFRNVVGDYKQEFFLFLFVATLQATGLVFASVVMEREAERLAREEDMNRANAKLKEVNTELEEAVRTGDEFLSIASHELRTPMTPLKLYFQVLKRAANNLDAPLSGQALVGKLASCERSLDRLSRLIDELLTVSRIRAGRMNINPESLGLSELVRDVMGQYQCELDFAKCGLKLDLEKGVRGNWDKMKIEEVIVNLITNAIKFNKGHQIEVSVKSEGASATLTVRDYGVGIATADQERIFQRFERAVSARHLGGLGLGLYIVRQIVEAHGGIVSVNSELGKGSTFTVRLPLQPAVSLKLVG